MHARVGKLIGASVSLAVLAALLGAIPAPARTPSSAAVPERAISSASSMSTVLPAAVDPVFNLCASVGSKTMSDGVAVPIWGFSLDSGSGCGPATLPGPQIEVSAGDAVTVNLTNVDVPQSVSLLIPGTSLRPDAIGVAAGGSASYSFTGSEPGTYLYQSGAGDQRGVLMGLYGAFIVRPVTAGQAYDTAASAFNTEATLVLSEVDPALNGNPTGFDLTKYAPKYWLISGRAYPETETIQVGAGQRALLRYLNAGSLHHTMALLGTNQRVIARDADPVRYPFDVVAETIPAGSTLDAIATIPAVAPVGSRLPLYSRQFHLTSGGAFPGGMLTYLQVNAPAVNQAPSVSAGSDQTVVTLAASLNATVTDDGLVQPLTTTWSQVSGPGTVTFADANAVDATVTFSAPGAYVLRLTADDGEFTVSDDVTVTVDLNLHVGDLDGTSVDVVGNRWRATVVITVHDALHGFTPGATVTGTWSAGDTNGLVLICTTDASGACSLTSGRLSRVTDASVIFTVTTVSKSGFTYQASANHDPDADSNGTSITVNRP